MVNLIGAHMSRNGVQKDWPTRGVLTYGGHGSGEQHPDTIVIYRESGGPERPPDLYTNPEAMTLEFARYWHDKSVPEWEVNQADYYTIMNEAVGSDEHELPIYTAYSLNRCQLAAEIGKKIVVGKLANGTPHFDLWKKHIAPMLVEAWDKHGAIYGRHVYGLQGEHEEKGKVVPHAGDLVHENGEISKYLPGYPYRIIDELEYLKAIGYGGGVFLCEVGLDGGYGLASWERFHFQITKFEQALRPYADMLIGFAWWECGYTGWKADYTNYLKEMTGYMSENSLPKWEPGEVTEPPEEKHKAIVVKIYQDATKEEYIQALETTYEKRHTATMSHDDTMTILRGGNDESYVKFSHPERDQETIELVEDAGYRWEPLYDENDNIILPVPHISQNGSTANERANDCGAACAAMVVRLAERYPTVDDVAIYAQSPPNSYMNFSQIDYALNNWGMNGTDERPFYTQGIENAIRDGLPVIALVKYPSLPYKFSTFQGCHFIVIYGVVDGSFVYRDPLQGETAVLELYITPDELTRAMYDVMEDGNRPAHGMTCAVKDEEPELVKIDLLPYLKGDGRLYEVRNTSGSQERFQTQDKGNGWFWQTKNKHAEQLFDSGAFIYRGWDTSPGGGRYYVQEYGGQPVAQWLPRHMAINESFTVSLFVQFYDWDCQPSAGNSGSVTDTRTFVEHLDSWTSPYGITLQDVIVIKWENGGEYYYYARDFGLVAWGRTHNDPNTPIASAISEIHAPGQRPDNEVDLPNCLA